MDISSIILILILVFGVPLVLSIVLSKEDSRNELFHKKFFYLNEEIKNVIVEQSSKNTVIQDKHILTIEELIRKDLSEKDIFKLKLVKAELTKLGSETQNLALKEEIEQVKVENVKLKSLIQELSEQNLENTEGE